MLTSLPPLGEFELLVLLAVLRLEGNAYAVSVREEIQTRTGRNAPRGSVYITLDRLKIKGYLKEAAAVGSPDRGGRPMRVFVTTASGKAAMKDALSRIARMQQGLAWLMRD